MLFCHFVRLYTNHAQRISRHFILRQFCHGYIFLHRSCIFVGRFSTQDLQNCFSIFSLRQAFHFRLYRNWQQVHQLHNPISRLTVTYHRSTDTFLHILTRIVYFPVGRQVSISGILSVKLLGVIPTVGFTSRLLK